MSTSYAAIVQVLHRFFYYLDEARYDAMLQLMEEDAVWHRQGRVLRGHAQTLGALQERSATLRIRHLVTNAFIDPDAPAATLRVRAYMTTYRCDDGRASMPPVLLKGPSGVLRVNAVLKERNGEWKIVELDAAPEFVFDPVPARP